MKFFKMLHDLGVVYELFSLIFRIIVGLFSATVIVKLDKKK